MSASYPNSVKVFTTRNANDVIQPAHVNDLQDEVNAIESGLLNGTAPLTSSQTTAFELFVTTPPPHARVFNSATLGVNNNNPTVLTFNSHRVVYPATVHSTSVNPSRMVPPSSGAYMITAHVQWSTASSAGTRRLDLLLNSVTVIARQQMFANSLGDNPTQSVGTIYNLSTSDYVEVQVYQDGGTTGAIVVNGNLSPEFACVKVR